MTRFALLALACFVGVVAATPADQEFLGKQNEIVKLLFKVHELNFHQDQVTIGKEWDPLAHLDNYKHVRVVKELVKDLTHDKLLHRGEIFNLFNEKHRRQVIMVFETFFFAKDWDTFHKTACWARDKVNEGMFVYALSVATLHRPDTRGLRLPPAYETYPHLFVTSKVIHDAYAAKMRQEPAVINMNFTGTIRNPEQRVAYFGEDVGMNSHHAHWHAIYPFWWDEAKYGMVKDRKGELFWYMHHQLIARFNAERLSNDLNQVEPLYWDKPIVEGFYPQTTYRKGGEFPARPDNFKFQDLRDIRIADLEAYEERIKEAISAGFVFDSADSNHMISLNNTEGINILGNLIEASSSSINPNYYGSLHNLGHIMLGRVVDPQGKFGMPPGVMEHFETATRDPAFFRLHKHIDNIFKQHKDTLPPYTHEELDVEGVTIKDVEVEDLVTYFEEFDIDMLNALDHAAGLTDVDIQARVQRLNHKPFVTKVVAQAETEKVVTVRIFLAPKFDWYGREIPLDKQRWEFIELDKFAVKLTPGENSIVRKSSESSVTIPDPLSTRALRKLVDDSIAGSATFNMDKDHKHCGVPDRLLLPKGKVNGMKYTLFVMLSDFEEDKVNELPHDYAYGGSVSYCGSINHKYPDHKSMGYPLDRKIPCTDQFKVTNMHFKDVEIKFDEHEH